MTGEPGQLPSRLPVEDVAIACVGVALLAAAALHAGRGGEEWRDLRLDRGHVAAAVRSEAWVRVNGEPAGAGFAPLSRFWRTRDGWVRTHANYPWHREALLRALRCGEDPEAVAAAIAGLGAVEVEDLVTGAGGVAAAVRTEADWQASPAGQAVAAARLVEGCLRRDAAWDGVYSIGGAAPRRSRPGRCPRRGSGCSTSPGSSPGRWPPATWPRSAPTCSGWTRRSVRNCGSRPTTSCWASAARCSTSVRPAGPPGCTSCWPGPTCWCTGTGRMRSTGSGWRRRLSRNAIPGWSW